MVRAIKGLLIRVHPGLGVQPDARQPGPVIVGNVIETHEHAGEFKEW